MFCRIIKISYYLCRTKQPLKTKNMKTTELRVGSKISVCANKNIKESLWYRQGTIESIVCEIYPYQFQVSIDSQLFILTCEQMIKEIAS